MILEKAVTEENDRLAGDNGLTGEDVCGFVFPAGEFLGHRDSDNVDTQKPTELDVVIDMEVLAERG